MGFWGASLERWILQQFTHVPINSTVSLQSMSRGPTWGLRSTLWQLPIMSRSMLRRWRWPKAWANKPAFSELQLAAKKRQVRLAWINHKLIGLTFGQAQNFARQCNAGDDDDVGGWVECHMAAADGVSVRWLGHDAASPLPSTSQMALKFFSVSSLPSHFSSGRNSPYCQPPNITMFMNIVMTLPHNFRPHIQQPWKRPSLSVSFFPIIHIIFIAIVIDAMITRVELVDSQMAVTRLCRRSLFVNMIFVADTADIVRGEMFCHV